MISMRNGLNFLQMLVLVLFYILQLTLDNIEFFCSRRATPTDGLEGVRY